MIRRACALLLLVWPLARADAAAVESLRDIPYATVSGKPLALDLHLPHGVTQPPLVVYVHGGAWSAGDKSSYPEFLVENGFAVASLDFRSTDVAPFPANVHDIKAAIRYLRASAGRYGFRADRIAVAGASSGGHLAALVGVTAGVPALEGEEGQDMGTSSTVQAIVSWYGASNLTTILSQSTPFGLGVREPALKRLLGDSPDNRPELARLASPVFHVDAADPPLLLLHGDQDRQMPINQLHELEGAYARVGREAGTFVLHGVGHDSAPFFRGEPAARVVAFLHRTMGIQP
ncbi:MAG: Lipase 2 [Pseudomonadota bacterium]|jgi:acetyl esterase/lipase